MRTEDVSLGEENDVDFEKLMLSSNTLAGLRRCGFVKPSPVQLRAIPLGRCGFDLIVEAKSGTGKTAVFGIIGLEMLSNQMTGFQMLVLAPTREIASQIGHVLRDIGSEYQGLNVEIVMGGTNVNEDIERLKKNKFQILVGSPGRILHLVKTKVLSLQTVRLFVLDEADKLMEESFQKDINYIYSHLPERKQLIAASATYTPELREFLLRYMRTPSHVKPYTSSILVGVVQKFTTVQFHGSSIRQNKIKFDKLLEILSQVPFKQSLVFCRYQVRAQTICDLLCQEGWPAEYLASSQNQSDRLNSLKKLQTYSCRILVATDLASRGIDAVNVDLVINIDVPLDSATYLHRIGRSGRYGSLGTAITIVILGEEESQFIDMLKTFDNIDNVTKWENLQNNIVDNGESKSEYLSCGQNIFQNKKEPENVNLYSLLSFSPNTEDLIPYNDFFASFKEFTGKSSSQKSSTSNLQTLNDKEKTDTSQIMMNNCNQSDKKEYFSEKNLDLKLFLENNIENFNVLNLVMKIPNEFDSNLPNTVCSKGKELYHYNFNDLSSSPKNVNIHFESEEKSHKKKNDFRPINENFTMLDVSATTSSNFKLNNEVFSKYENSPYSCDDFENIPNSQRNSKTQLNNKTFKKCNKKFQAKKQKDVQFTEKRQSSSSNNSMYSGTQRKSKNSGADYIPFCNIPDDYDSNWRSEDEEEYNWGLQEYYEFKRQLDTITSQIQQSVYISTLLNK